MRDVDVLNCVNVPVLASLRKHVEAELLGLLCFTIISISNIFAVYYNLRVCVSVCGDVISVRFPLLFCIIGLRFCTSMPGISFEKNFPVG